MEMNEGLNTMEAFLKDKGTAASVRVALLALLVVLVACATFPAFAFGATNSVSIPVEQIFRANDGAASSGTFTYVLTPRYEGQPMPVGSVNDVYTFSITGSNTRTVVIGGFSTAGYFFYELRLAERAVSEYYTLDDIVHTLVIAVTNNVGGGVTARLSAVVVGTEMVEAAKREYIRYEHAFDDEEAGVAENDTGNDGAANDGDGPGANDDGPGGPGDGAGTATTDGGPGPGPKTGDDSLHPSTLMAAMVISAVIALFTLALIYADRRSEQEHGGLAV